MMKVGVLLVCLNGNNFIVVFIHFSQLKLHKSYILLMNLFLWTHPQLGKVLPFGICVYFSTWELSSVSNCLWVLKEGVCSAPHHFPGNSQMFVASVIQSLRVLRFCEGFSNIYLLQCSSAR